MPGGGGGGVLFGVGALGGAKDRLLKKIAVDVHEKKRHLVFDSV